MFGLFLVFAGLLGMFGTSVDNGSIELKDKPPYVHIVKEKAHIEYTYPVSR